MDRLMNSSRKIILSFTGAYALGVLVVILVAFDFEGRIDFGWTLFLILVTLPWSVVSILFAWALIHGAGLETFAVIYLAFGALNGYFLGRLWLRRREHRDTHTINVNNEHQN